jgi:hypothetical protein
VKTYHTWPLEHPVEAAFMKFKIIAYMVNASIGFCDNRLYLCKICPWKKLRSEVMGINV